MASIENRGKGKWRITVSNGYDAAGKKRYVKKTVSVDPSHTIGSQRREVEKLAAELETDLGRHVITDTRRVTIQALADEWIADRRRALAISTIAYYEDLLHRHIVPRLGHIVVQDLTPKQISRFYNEIAAIPVGARSKTGFLSGNALLHYHRTLSSMLGYAKRVGYISINPCDNVTPPRNDTGEAKYLEPADAVRMLDAFAKLPIMYRTFYTMSLYTSCRPGELIGLNWSDIAGNILTVRAGSVRLPGGQGTIRTDRPKTKSSVRLIALPQECLELLAQWKAKQDELKAAFGEDWPDPEAVFTGDLGHRIDVHNPSRRFNRFLKANPDLPKIPLYALRHTGATLLISQGVSVRDISQRLGHAQTSTTVNFYTHALADAAARTTATLAAVLRPAKAPQPQPPTTGPYLVQDNSKEATA